MVRQPVTVRTASEGFHAGNPTGAVSSWTLVNCCVSPCSEGNPCAASRQHPAADCCKQPLKVHGHNNRPRTQQPTCTRTSPSASTRHRPSSSRSSSCVAHISQSSPTSTGSCRTSATSLYARHDKLAAESTCIRCIMHHCAIHQAALPGATSTAAVGQDLHADNTFVRTWPSTKCSAVQSPRLNSLCQPSSYEGSLYSSANRGCSDVRSMRRHALRCQRSP